MIYGFAVPAQYQALLAAGQLVRRGALLINADGGGIVAHLQETGALARAVGGFANPLTAVTQLATLATNMVTVAQNNQIKKQIDLVQTMLGAVQGLQVATLATSVIGLGVSAAGSAIVCQRIEALRHELGELGKDLSDFRSEWNIDRLETLLGTARTRLERLESVSSRTNPRIVLEEAEPILHEVFNEMAARGRKLLMRDNVPIAALQIIMNGMAISGGARIKSLFLMDEGEEAKRSAHAQVTTLIQMTHSMPADRLAGRISGSSTPKEDSLQVARLASDMRYQLASIPPLIDHLAMSDFRPSAYLAAAEEEKDQPLMFLPVAAG